MREIRKSRKKDEKHYEKWDVNIKNEKIFREILENCKKRKTNKAESTKSDLFQLYAYFDTKYIHSLGRQAAVDIV